MLFRGEGHSNLTTFAGAISGTEATRRNTGGPQPVTSPRPVVRRMRGVRVTSILIALES